MDDGLDIPRVASLLADPARAAMLWALIDGTSRPAGELAFAANASPQSASAHLAKLVEGGLLVAQAQGRHRYFRIASPEAAHLVESMASFGASLRPRIPRHPALVRSMPGHFVQARTCYDHLAGEVAVAVLQALLDAGWLTAVGPGYEPTPLGAKRLAALGIDASHAACCGRRAFARGCVDLTQRRQHLAGVLGAALLDLYVREGWILRTAGTRVVHMTPKGRSSFKRVLGVSV